MWMKKIIDRKAAISRGVNAMCENKERQIHNGMQTQSLDYFEWPLQSIVWAKYKANPQPRL